MLLKDWIEKCKGYGIWCHVLYEGDIYLIHTNPINNKCKSTIAIKNGDNYPTADGYNSGEIFNLNDKIVPVVVIRYDLYFDPIIAYMYDTKQVIFEFDHWTV